MELNELIEQRRRDIDSYEQRIAATAAETAEIEGNLGGLRERLEVAELEVARSLMSAAGIAAAVEEMQQRLCGSCAISSPSGTTSAASSRCSRASSR